MSDEAIKYFWQNLAGIIAAIFAGLSLLRSSRNAKAIEINATTLATVETKVDGMTSDLVKATASKNLAEGQLKERDAQREYVDNPQDPKSVVPINGEGDDPLKVTLVKKKE